MLLFCIPLFKEQQLRYPSFQLQTVLLCWSSTARVLWTWQENLAPFFFFFEHWGGLFESVAISISLSAISPFSTFKKVIQIIMNIYLHMCCSLGSIRDTLCSLFPGFFLDPVIWTFCSHCDIYETLHRLLTLCGANMNWLWFPLRGNFILH